METWTVNGTDIEAVGPQEAAERWAGDRPDAVGVVVVRDNDGLIAGEWNAEDLRD